MIHLHAINDDGTMGELMRLNPYCIVEVRRNGDYSAVELVGGARRVAFEPAAIVEAAIDGWLRP